MARRGTRWIPAAIAVAAVTAAAVGVPLAASASAPLAPKSARQLIAMMASAKVTQLSGTVEQESDLGLPSLPSTGSGSTVGGSAGDSAASSIIELLSGTHTAKVFIDGASKLRVQVLDSQAERDVIRNGSTVWLYDSKKHTAAESTVRSGHRSAHDSKFTPATPSEIATRLVASLKSSSRLSVGSDVGVAGRSAYDLVLMPRASDTLLGSVHIAVDSVTGLPLRVDVDARGSSAPAVRIGFTDLTLTKPAASVFAFTPPANTKVTKARAHGSHPKGSHPSGTHPKGSHPASAKPTTKVTGSGWDAVIEVAQGVASKSGSSAKQLQGLTSSPLFSQLTTAVTGGRAFSTTLFTVFIADDGTIFAGSVPLSRLQTVASAS